MPDAGHDAMMAGEAATLSHESAMTYHTPSSPHAARSRIAFDALSRASCHATPLLDACSSSACWTIRASPSAGAAGTRAATFLTRQRY